MTLGEKVGQLLMVGFRGLEAGPRSAISRAVRTGCVGGVVLFDRDLARNRGRRNIASTAQVRELADQLQAVAAVPLLVAVDQEGGRVARLKEKHGFPEMPSARSLGAADDPAETRRRAGETAAALAACGINLNFAPVVDLDLFPENPVIGKYGRSFSAEAAVVLRQARAVIEAHRRQGVACCLKHFPGHGSSRQDSHLGFTDVSRTWRPRELEPYRALFAAGYAGAVMTAHIFNRRLDTRLPATLSRPTLEGLLRRKLGFRGVVVSDDLDMGALRAEFSREEVLERALNAGCDILLIANNLSFSRDVARRTQETILGLAASGRVRESRIDEACRRVLELKSRIFGRRLKP